MIESELFGHRRGAFTGAVADRQRVARGLRSAGDRFLDEIGELETAVQVKLLRVVQSLVYAKTGSYLAMALQLKLHRRTVKGTIDSDLLKRLNTHAAT